MSYDSLRNPDRYHRDSGSPFDPQIPTRKGCMDCGAELTETKDGDLVCLNCQADEAHEAHRKMER